MAMTLGGWLYFVALFSYTLGFNEGWDDRHAVQSEIDRFNKWVDGGCKKC